MITKYSICSEKVLINMLLPLKIDDLIKNDIGILINVYYCKFVQLC